MCFICVSYVFRIFGIFGILYIGRMHLSSGRLTLLAQSPLGKSAVWHEKGSRGSQSSPRSLLSPTNGGPLRISLPTTQVVTDMAYGERLNQEIQHKYEITMNTIRKNI